MSLYQRWGKRAVDLLAVIVLAPVVLPIVVVAGLLVRIVMGPPVLFRQLRPGHQSKPFTLVKFRTMNGNRDEQGSLLPDKARLTRLGALLRCLSVDELPQFWNVLKGDMSLVGPRPLLMEYLSRYTPEQARRHEVKPGITGWAQVNGRNAITWEQKFALDQWYVDHQSFSLDMKILLKTFKKTLASEGVSQPGRATADEFRGSRS